MASLDKLEGDVIELALFAVLVIVAILVFLAWKGVSGFDPTKALLAAIRKLWNAIDSLFSNAVTSLQPSSAQGGLGVGAVYTGSNLQPTVEDYGPTELDEVNNNE